ncbi:hypothetical protein ACJX0J_011757, partial [Zea mays]
MVLGYTDYAVGIGDVDELSRNLVESSKASTMYFSIQTRLNKNQISLYMSSVLMILYIYIEGIISIIAFAQGHATIGQGQFDCEVDHQRSVSLPTYGSRAQNFNVIRHGTEIMGKASCTAIPFFFIGGFCLDIQADWAAKLKHWKDEFISTLQHYWLGTKLLWADVRISSRLLVKLASGKSLTRRERQQLTRTTADLFRLVPFAVFIIVPFMELLLPVFLKLFPNMLPSTFQDKMKEEEALKRKLKARMEYAKFLQDTAKEMAKEVQTSRSGEMKQTAEDLDEFLNKVRKGGHASNDEILSFAKLFNDELTLDNMSRPRLVNMCKYMGIQPFGTDHYLRFMLRKKLQDIKNDDKMIQAEGVESLSEYELRQACRERGHLGLLSTEEMRQQ